MIAKDDVLILCTDLIDVMRNLEILLAEETDLVKNHAYDKLPELHKDKARLSKAYMEFMAAIRDNLELVKDVAPDLVERIRSRHDRMQMIIRENMTAIAAAKAVSESLIGTISDEVQKQRQPVTSYSSRGATNQPKRQNMALAVNGRY